LAQRLVVEAEIGGTFFLRLFETKRAGSDRNAIAVFQQMLELLFAVDKDLVRASFDLTVDDDAIDNHERSIVVRFDVRVVPRRAWVVKHNLIIRRAPNHARGARV